MSKIKVLVSRHKVLILGGVMLGAGIVIGTRLPISYDRLLKECSVFDNVAAVVSERPGYAVDLLERSSKHETYNSYSMTLDSAKDFYENLGKAIKEATDA